MRTSCPRRGFWLACTRLENSSIHNGGGVGIGYSQHSGQVTVADGTKEMEKRIERVLTNDPGLGVARHVDAGYPEAIAFAKKTGVKVPMG